MEAIARKRFRAFKTDTIRAGRGQRAEWQRRLRGLAMALDFDMSRRQADTSLGPLRSGFLRLNSTLNKPFKLRIAQDTRVRVGGQQLDIPQCTAAMRDDMLVVWRRARWATWSAELELVRVHADGTSIIVNQSLAGNVADFLVGLQEGSVSAEEIDRFAGLKRVLTACSLPPDRLRTSATRTRARSAREAVLAAVRRGSLSSSTVADLHGLLRARGVRRPESACAAVSDMHRSNGDLMPTDSEEALREAAVATDMLSPAHAVFPSCVSALVVVWLAGATLS